MEARPIIVTQAYIWFDGLEPNLRGLLVEEEWFHDEVESRPIIVTQASDFLDGGMKTCSQHSHSITTRTMFHSITKFYNDSKVDQNLSSSQI